jgi:hypothetical protein
MADVVELPGGRSRASRLRTSPSGSPEIANDSTTF